MTRLPSSGATRSLAGRAVGWQAELTLGRRDSRSSGRLSEEVQRQDENCFPHTGAEDRSFPQPTARAAKRRADYGKADEQLGHDHDAGAGNKRDRQADREGDGGHRSKQLAEGKLALVDHERDSS